MKTDHKQRLYLGGIHLAFFLTTWLLLSWYYGEVMYIAQQNSFFSSESITMEFITGHRPYGYLWWMGRAMLQLFHHPWLGGGITALMLTLISGMTAYVFRLKGKFYLLQFIPAWAWLIYSFYKGYDLYYQAETGQILGVPICIFIILLLQAGFIRTFSKKKVASVFLEKQAPSKQWFLEMAAVLLVPLALITGNETVRAYVRPTAHMQCALQKQDWQEMIETAKECNVSARPIAAYYAIALMQTGNITESLFDIEYNYEDIQLHDRNGEKEYGAGYYEADANLHSGLILTAYKNAMERLTMEGPTILSLKLLAETALLNGEKELCDKYLHLLKTVPFEKEFVEYISFMNDNPEAITQDSRFANILQVRPVDDSFETTYRKPLFLGYNVSLLKGRSMNALQASLAACLYSKQMGDFLVHTEPLVNATLPRTIEDALVMESYKNNEINKVFRISDLTRSRYEMFMNAAAPYRHDREKGAQALKEQFLGYFPYYYHFGNINAEGSPEDSNKKEQHTGVN